MLFYIINSYKMNDLSQLDLAPVPNLNVDIGKLIFNLAVPNIIMWVIVICLVICLFYLRLPKIFEPKK